MTQNRCKGSRINLEEVFGAGQGSLKGLLREVLQGVSQREG
jgi:hypothetical protein